MGLKHTKALKKRWAGVSSEKRSEHARMMAVERMKKLSLKERKKIGNALTGARLAKQT